MFLGIAASSPVINNLKHRLLGVTAHHHIGARDTLNFIKQLLREQHIQVHATALHQEAIVAHYSFKYPETSAMKFSTITSHFTLRVFSVQGRAEQDLLSFQSAAQPATTFVFKFVAEETVVAPIFLLLIHIH